jgi:hypothetical protein
MCNSPLPDLRVQQQFVLVLDYDVSPDGRTFAMVRRSPATRIMVIQNLPGLVRRLRGATGESR